MGVQQIKEGAIFIADSHYPHHGDEFLQLLLKINSGEIKTPQIFLMGDNFDLLFGDNNYILRQNNNTNVVNLLLDISEDIDVFYIEGNHDFCLKEVFPDMQVYSRDEQPVHFELNGQRVAISHGDKYVTGFGYDLYCKVLRNKVTLSILKPFQKLIIDHRIGKLAQKEICRSFVGFEKRVEQILEHYEDADLVIEGHFHQAKTIGKYISLPSLACQGQFGVIEEGKVVFKTL